MHHRLPALLRRPVAFGRRPTPLRAAALGVLLLAAGALAAQPADDFRRFRAFPTVGYNASQIDGDNLAGFYKSGLSAGLGVHTMLDDEERFSVSFEILYNQKGSRSRPGIRPLDRVTTDYIDVPVQVHYHDKGRMIFGAGLSFGNLVRSRVLVNDTLRNDVSDGFEPRELGYLFTATIMAGDHLGIGLRYSGSFTSFGASVNPAVSGLIHRTVGIRMSWIL
jgi:hypothetical protein